MAAQVASLEAVLDLDKRGFDRGLKQSQGLLNKLAGLGAGGVAGIGLVERGVSALADTLVDSVQKGAQLEAQLDAIAAVGGNSAEEMAELKQLIEELGLDPNLKVSAFEAADAIEMLTRNGLKFDDIMQGAARTTVLLANATGADFGRAADIATDSMAIFGIEAAKMEDAVNGITSVVNNSKFSIDDYALALAQGGGVAGAAGVDFDDFNTAITGISSLFASGSDAGTSFKTFLTRLIPASNDAKDAMMELGIITEEGMNRFFDAEGNLKSMADVSGILEDAMAGLSEEQKNQALQTIFGNDAMRAAVGLAELGDEGFRKLNETMAQTDAVEGAATRMDNLAGRMEILSGQFETAQLQLSDKLNPALTKMLDTLIDLSGDALPATVEILGTTIEVFGDLEVVQGASDFLTVFFDIITGLNEQLDKMNERLGFSNTNFDFMRSILGDITNVLLGILVPITNLSDAIRTLTDIIPDFTSNWSSVQKVLSGDIKIPDFLKTKSPPPLATGLEMINEQLRAMPSLSSVFGNDTNPAALTGATDQSKNITVNIGGVSATTTTGGNANDATIRMVIQMLRAQLEAAG